MISGIINERITKAEFSKIIDSSSIEEFFQLFNNFLIDKYDDGLGKLHKFIEVNSFLDYLLKEKLVTHNFSNNYELIDFIKFYYGNDLDFVKLMNFFMNKNIPGMVYRRELLKYLYSIRVSFSINEKMFNFVKDLKKEYSISNMINIMSSIHYEQGYGFNIIYNYYKEFDEFKVFIEIDNIDRNFKVNFNNYKDFLDKIELLDDLIDDKNTLIILKSLKDDFNKIFRN